ncbi:hypothetical protein DP117_20265 [Brasilonema sp. UFV-L1]|nr:hypothetical protein [Brasilonema sp. UFV-L1]
MWRQATGVSPPGVRFAHTRRVWRGVSHKSAALVKSLRNRNKGLTARLEPAVEQLLRIPWLKPKGVR